MPFSPNTAAKRVTVWRWCTEPCGCVYSAVTVLPMPTVNGAEVRHVPKLHTVAVILSAAPDAWSFCSWVLNVLLVPLPLAGVAPGADQDIDVKSPPKFAVQVMIASVGRMFWSNSVPQVTTTAPAGGVGTGVGAAVVPPPLWVVVVRFGGNVTASVLEAERQSVWLQTVAEMATGVSPGKAMISDVEPVNSD